MKRMMSSLLLSTALLIGCASEEPAPTEMGGVVDEELENVVEEDQEEQKDNDDTEKEEKEVTKRYKSYFGTPLEVDEEAQNLVSENNLTGVYIARTPEDYENPYTLPESVYLEINDDGTFTRYHLTTPVVSVDKETNLINDDSFAEYKLKANVDEFALSRLESESNRLAKERTFKVTYIDEGNNVHIVSGEVPTFHDIEIVSGQLKMAYGDIQFEAHEKSTLKASYDQEGKIEFSDANNFTHETSVSPPHYTTTASIEGFASYFNNEEYKKSTTEDIKYEVFKHDGKLKSASQAYEEVHDVAKEKTRKKNKIDDTARHTRYFMNSNELLQHLTTTNILHNIITNTKDFVGYTEDNIEVTPDIIFENGASYYTLLEEGKVYKFQPNNSTWEPHKF